MLVVSIWVMNMGVGYRFVFVFMGMALAWSNRFGVFMLVVLVVNM